MGWKDAGWAYSLDLPTAPKAVLAAIAHATDDRTHETYVGQKTIAHMVSMSVATVNRALGVLDDLHVISRSRRSGAGGYRTTDMLTLNVLTYIAPTYVAETYVGETHLGLTHDLHDSDAPPTSLSASAEEIIQIDQPEDQPEILPMTLDDEFEAFLRTPIDPEEIQFPAFWTIWPKKVSKLDAAKAWSRAIKKAPRQVIYDAAKAYATSPYLPPRQFIPHAASWLNAERWSDPPLEPDTSVRRPTRNDESLAYLAELAQREQAQKEISA